MRKAKTLAVLSLTFLTAVAGTGISRADDSKPKAQPAVTENISLNFTKLETSYREGAPGPSISLTGILHLVSRTLVSDDGTPVGFILEPNQSDGVAAGIDGVQSFVAVGASGAIPAECEPESCPPPFWVQTFRLVPTVSEGALAPSLFFDLTLKTEYDANGRLVNACLAGLPDCDDAVLIP
jgi:hypothetical protein